MKIEILNQDRKVLWSGEDENLAGGLITAIKSGANLAGASLSDAYLSGAKLAGANLPTGK